VTPDESSVDWVHPAKICLGILIENTQPRRAPPASQVKSQPSVLGDSVADPARTRAVFYYDDEPATVVEVPHRNTAASSGSSAHRFDDEGVLARIWRSRYASDDCEVRDRIRDSNYGSRKPHESPPRRIVDRR
jgi:hypothetical protein